MMKKRILLIALIGMSFGINAQEKIQTEIGLKNDFIYNNGKVGIGTTNPDQGIAPDLQRKLLVNGGITLKSGGKLSYDPSYYVHAYSEYNNSVSEARFLNYGYYGHRWETRAGIGMVMLGNNGYVGIGTNNPDAKLAVNGKIHTKEVKVDLIGWSDFVFEKDYNLPTLKEVENHIREKGHLKDIPSAKEVEQNGIFLGEMNSKLLQKIEELTLYTIEQDKKIKKLESLNAKLLELQKRLENLEKK